MAKVRQQRRQRHSHERFMKIAERVAKECVGDYFWDEDEHEEGFSLTDFLDKLSTELLKLTCDTDFLVGTEHIARYLWLVMPRPKNETADSHTFRGVPILD